MVMEHTIYLIINPYFYLRLSGELSFKEIAEIMDKTENWVRITFYRGKEKLREVLV